MTDEANSPFLRRALRVSGRVIVTAVFSAFAVFAIIIGQGILSDRAAAVPQPPAAEPTPVMVQSVEHQKSYSVRRAFLGQIEPRVTVDVSFERAGRVIRMEIAEGDYIEKGDVIAQLDTALLRAEEERLNALKSATQAQLDFAVTRVQRAEDLQKRGFTSLEARDQAVALRDELINRIAETDAALKAVAINLSKSTIYAPISGQVAGQLADEAETVTSGQPIATLMETSFPEFRVGLPLDVVPDVLDRADIRFGEKTVQAELLQLRPDIDPVTRTRTALFGLPPDPAFVFGQTATLLLDIDIETRGFWVALDALKQGDGSVWTVLTVDHDNIVRRAAVQVIHAEQDRVFVSGSLQDGDQLISQGAHRAVPGQSVRITGAEG